MYHSKRKGISIIECLILTIVLLVAIGAIFTTVYAANRSYVRHKQAKDAREMLFTWFQAFESQWPPAEDFYLNTAGWNAAAGNPRSAITAMREVSNRLGGTWYGGAENRARLGNYVVDVAFPPNQGNLAIGKMDIQIEIRENALPRRRILDQTRTYNIYMLEAVSDDVLVQARVNP